MTAYAFDNQYGRGYADIEGNRINGTVHLFNDEADADQWVIEETLDVKPGWHETFHRNIIDVTQATHIMRTYLNNRHVDATNLTDSDIADKYVDMTWRWEHNDHRNNR